MKKGHNPNYEQKVLLGRYNLDPSEWLLFKTTKSTYQFRHKTQKRAIEINQVFVKPSKNQTLQDLITEIAC